MTRFVHAAAMVAVAVLLAGCYESNSMLLDASQARQPISTYQDWTYNHSDGTYHAHLNPRSDGWYEYDEAPVDKDGKEGTWAHHTVLLNYLENTGGYTVYVSGTWDDDEHAYVYSLVAFDSSGRWQSVSPSCDVTAGNDQEYKLDTGAAKSAGAELKNGDIEDICLFATADSLFQAMRTVAGDPGFANRVAEAMK